VTNGRSWPGADTGERQVPGGWMRALGAAGHCVHGTERSMQSRS